MKRAVAICCLGLGAWLAGCGGDAEPEGGDRPFATHSTAPGEPTVRVPPGPPPDKLVVRDVREGSGPKLDEPTDELHVHYVGASYATRDEFYNTWDRGGPSKYLLEEVHRGWELGLKGMRVGGRRELIEPSKLAYGTGALVFVIDLVKVRE